MKRLLCVILLVSSLFISGCGNIYLDNLDDIQLIVDKAYSRVNQLGVSGSLVNVVGLTDSLTNESYWIPKEKIIPIHSEYLVGWVRKFTKNDYIFVYNDINLFPDRYAIYQIEEKSKYYIIYNEPLAVEGILSVALKSKTGFGTQSEAIAHARANLIPRLIYDSTSLSTNVEEHVKAVSENFEIIEIFSPLKYTESEEKIKAVYPLLEIKDLTI